jgi:hypothetical protein
MAEKEIDSLAKSNQWSDKNKMVFLKITQQLAGLSHSEIDNIIDVLKRFVDRHSYLRG